MSLLSAAGAKEVEAAIARAEERSAGEVVVAVVRRSAGYELPRLVMTAAWTVAVALLLRRHLPELSCRWVLLSQLPVGLLAWFLLGLTPVLRLLAGNEADTAVRARAMQLFAERGVYNTRDRSGLLILISELEHRVVILGDKGVDARLGPQGWQEQVQKVVQGIQQRRVAAALVEVIDALGELLAQHFPRRMDDANELPDQVIREP